MFYVLAFLVFVVVGFFSIRSLVAAANEKERKAAARERLFAEIPAKVARAKSAYVPHLIELLQKSFPACADEIDELSKDAFYEGTTEWRNAYAKDFTAEIHRERTIENPGFPAELKAQQIQTLPPKLRALAMTEFDEWYRKMNGILKLASEKALVER